MKRLWLLFAAVMILSFPVLGWIGTRIYQEMPPFAEQVVTTDGTSRRLTRARFRRARTSGNRSAAWKSVRSGGTAAMSLPTGPPTGCTEKRSFILDRWANAEFGSRVRRARRRAAGPASGPAWRR